MKNVRILLREEVREGAFGVTVVAAPLTATADPNATKLCL
jgi:hypothetical protein